MSALHVIGTLFLLFAAFGFAALGAASFELAGEMLRGRRFGTVRLGTFRACGGVFIFIAAYLVFVAGGL